MPAGLPLGLTECVIGLGDGGNAVAQLDAIWIFSVLAVNEYSCQNAEQEYGGPPIGSRRV